MLDVHPPHHAATTWRDFFIHIATIVLGLLIAIGLEQTVEYFHHRRQVAETAQALREERQHNIKQFAIDTAIFHSETTRFQTNLAVLLYVKTHPTATRESWPGQINWHTTNVSFSDSAWVTAQQDNVTALMPQQEVRAQERLYGQLAAVEAGQRDRLRAITDARRYMVQDSDPAHLTPSQLEEQILLTQSVLISHYRMGSEMRNLNVVYPDFKPGPTTQELIDIVHEPHTADYLHGAAGLGLSLPLPTNEEASPSP